MTFSILPKSDDDFTPELARKIIAKYQELVAIWKERHDLVLRKHMECCSRPSPRERALERAALDFIHKVDRGEAKSTKSYAAFKAALEWRT